MNTAISVVVLALIALPAVQFTAGGLMSRALAGYGVIYLTAFVTALVMPHGYSCGGVLEMVIATGAVGLALLLSFCIRRLTHVRS